MATSPASLYIGGSPTACSSPARAAPALFLPAVSAPPHSGPQGGLRSLQERTAAARTSRPGAPVHSPPGPSVHRPHRRRHRAEDLPPSGGPVHTVRLLGPPPPPKPHCCRPTIRSWAHLAPRAKGRARGHGTEAQLLPAPTCGPARRGPHSSGCHRSSLDPPGAGLRAEHGGGSVQCIQAVPNSASLPGLSLGVFRLV